MGYAQNTGGVLDLDIVADFSGLPEGTLTELSQGDVSSSMYTFDEYGGTVYAIDADNMNSAIEGTDTYNVNANGVAIVYVRGDPLTDVLLFDSSFTAENSDGKLLIMDSYQVS